MQPVQAPTVTNSSIANGLQTLTYSDGSTRQLKADNPTTANLGGGATGAGMFSPTTISNENKVNEIPGLNNQLNNLSQRGSVTNGEQTIFPNGQVDTYQTPTIPAGSNPVYGNVNGIDGRITGYSQPDYATGQQQITYFNPVAEEDRQINDLIAQMKANSDAQTAAQMEQIQQRFTQLKDEQNRINSQQQAAIGNVLMMGGVTGGGGSAKYAPISSEGIVAEQLNYGLKQIAELDRQEQQLIMQAKQAQSERDYEIMAEMINQVEKKRSEKLELVAEQNKKLAEAQAKYDGQQLSIAKNNALASLYESGITDANQLVKQMSQLGYEFSVKEAKEAVDAFNDPDRQAFSDLLVNAASQGAPTDLITQAQQAPSLIDAAKILGTYGGDYYKTALLQEQIKTEQAQRAKIYTDINAAKAASVITSGDISASQTPQVQAWVSNIVSDRAKLSDVPTNLKNAVAVGLANSPISNPNVNSKIEATQAVYDLAEELKTLPGLSSAVGVGFSKTILGRDQPIAGTSRANYEAKVAQLKDTLASANLDKLKGAMSDKDIEFLRNTATALNLNMSESAFKKELDKIANKALSVPGVQAYSQDNAAAAALAPQKLAPTYPTVQSVENNGNLQFNLQQ